MADHAASSTQEQYPWRAVLRTVLALVIGLAGSWAVIVDAAGVDPSWQWVTSSLAVAAAITRLMAVPYVNQLLQRIGLGATPKPTPANPALKDEYHEVTRGNLTIHDDGNITITQGELNITGNISLDPDH